MNDLLPCPFCGSTDLRLSTPESGFHGYWYVCNQCDAEGRTAVYREEATEAWNSRVRGEFDPCPFCGLMNLRVATNGKSFWVSCECGGNGPLADNHEAAINAWNKGDL